MPITLAAQQLEDNNARLHLRGSDSRKVQRRHSDSLPAEIRCGMVMA
jgi:hypothetical protein